MEIPKNAALPLFSSKRCVQEVPRMFYRTSELSKEKAAAIWVIAIEATQFLPEEDYYDILIFPKYCLSFCDCDRQNHKKGKVCTKWALNRSPDGPGVCGGCKKDANPKMLPTVLLNSRKPSFSDMEICKPISVLL